MKIEELAEREDRSIGEEIHALISELYPICRSITGDGLRESLRRIGRGLPLTIHEVPSGTRVFDWVVPREWNIRGAFLKDPSGETVVDFRDSNLHVLNYSVPIRGKLPLSELKEHLFTLPDQPDLIPYRTSYYRENWGFCLSHRRCSTLREGEYEVSIDSRLEDGHLTYGELFIPGRSEEEFLVSCHSCHPSLANDNLSGVAVATFLARSLLGQELNLSYRFLFIPGTIGSITWLARNEDRVSRIKHGLVLACLGDPGGFTYKRSRGGNAAIDRAVRQVLGARDGSRIVDFEPYGYDERQYCSPAFDLPVGCLSRTPHGEFPEYHTSADDLSFVRSDALGGSLSTCLAIIAVLEGNRTYLNLNPRCEPNLGKRGLYSMVGGLKGAGGENAILWVLNLSDGKHSLLDIAERSGLEFGKIRSAADALLACSLIREAGGLEEKGPGSQGPGKRDE